MSTKEYIDLHLGQWLSDLYDEIPSNRIIHKVLTGIGATYSEIMNRLRNSIIVVPNIPVINGKVKFHKNHENPIIIRSVTGNVRKDTILNYLQNDSIKVKKLMTTPESFHVIMEVMELLDINVFEEYFLLIDECDKMILDSHYRDGISDPMDYFFKFKNKSIVSATVINPSDPRFSKHNFKTIAIRPTFDFSQNIDLLVTNNPIEAFIVKYKEIKKLKDGGEIFVFFNSLNGILKLIDKAKIKANYSIFCSDTSKSKLKIESSHANNTFTNVSEKDISKINFLTSRFYTAVDIFVKKPPHVIIISDAVFLPGTMVDAKTDVVQIKGRFREIELGSITCISNHTTRHSYLTEEDAKESLKLNQYVYNEVSNLKRLSALENDKEVISNLLKYVHYNKFMRNEFEENTYMKDNFIYRNKLIETYSSNNNWINSFMIYSNDYHYFNPTIKTYYANSITGYGSNSNTKKFRDNASIIVNQIKRIKESGIKLMVDEQLDELRRNYPEILEGYELLGEESVLKYSTSKKRLLREILLYKQKLGIFNNFDFLDELKVTFSVNTFYPESNLKSLASSFIDKYNLEFSKDYYMKFLKKVLIFSSRTEKRIKGIQTKGYYVREVIYK